MQLDAALAFLEAYQSDHSLSVGDEQSHGSPIEMQIDPALIAIDTVVGPAPPSIATTDMHACIRETVGCSVMFCEPGVLSDAALVDLDKQMGLSFSTSPPDATIDGMCHSHGCQPKRIRPTDEPVRLQPLWESDGASPVIDEDSLQGALKRLARQHQTEQRVDTSTLESFEHKPSATPVDMPAPCTADLRLIGANVITCEELLAYLPKHLTIEAVLRRLLGNGWECADICAVVNYYRGWTGREALAMNTITQNILRLEKRYNDGRVLTETQRDEFYQPVWDFTPGTWVAADARRKQTNNLLIDLTNGVRPDRRPKGVAAGPLTKCIEYAEQHLELELRLSDVQQIIIEQGFPMPEMGSNIDSDALERMHEATHTREYRFPGGESCGKGKETARSTSKRRRITERNIARDLERFGVARKPRTALHRYAPY